MLHHKLWIDDPLGEVVFRWDNGAPAARSLAFLCTHCGATYAKLFTCYNSHLQPFSAVHGCCHLCPGSRYYVPGSLEAATLIGWHNLPLDVVNYQLSQELAFYDSIHHPRYEQENSQCY